MDAFKKRLHMHANRLCENRLHAYWLLQNKSENNFHNYDFMKIGITLNNKSVNFSCLFTIIASPRVVLLY